MDDLTKLLKECEADKGSEGLAEGIKKAKVGIINLKAYLQQVKCCGLFKISPIKSFKR